MSYSYYTIYKITNNINGKYYIGQHRTNNLNDSYFGSGLLLIKAIKKYGKENFTKEILFIFDNEIDMNNKEKEIVTEEFTLLEETYNMAIGGNVRTHTEEIKRKIGEASKRNAHLYKTEEYRNKMSISIKKYIENHGSWWIGRKHSKETKQLMSEKKKGMVVGKNNSQYGTCWITNEKENKKINKNDFYKWEAQGFRKGRVMDA